MAGRGPLPKPDDQRRRRNAPTIPTTALPAEGFAGPYPDPPDWVVLGEQGLAWWTWAWRTPEAAGWPAGSLRFIARRAEIEDDLAVLELVGGLDVADLLSIEPSQRTRELTWMIRRLHSLAVGRLALQKEAREIESRLGLTPKGLADLRWTIVAEKEPAAQAAPASTKGRTKSKAPVRRLRVVDRKGA